jgi:predicted nucleic acid-binding protein
MSVKTFVDTSVRVYAHDIDEAEKRSICKKRLVELLDTRMGVLSPQVLQSST